ncbi:LacI family DNA-binding transcriptional regulator [Coraliomargarita sp. SDUM461004]|uniref:LacI family DNA-binding transcriptional regulator n=1 Tax=Thalassobacterium sedimentorum TaxID=3041258 RepID=A0ABU1AJF1_9BACT|nr:LacI family DNA-binding transcriptional regulator [Coraliomargarita sp. SDUM461004]MDQ8194942.1 LacI family DNA-binding transcriptional regulator [Coraliomargarita sp. SDUM461004]
MKGHVSQRDLAKIAGVSPMTVSLSLRSHPSIPEQTRIRIQKLAVKHNYHPDPALSALNAYRTSSAAPKFQGTIGWVTAFATKTGWKEMIQLSGYYDGVRKRAQELGYKIEHFWIKEPKMSAPRATNILLARNIQGLIIAPLPTSHSKIELKWEHFSSVTLGYSLESPKLHVIMNNQFRNIRSVVKKLHNLGYRRIGFAMPSANDERVDHNYLGGYWIAQRELRLSSTSDSPPPLLANDFNERTFLDWLKSNNPDAIIISSTLIHEIKGWLKKIHLEVPNDIGLAVAATPYQDDYISGIDEGVCSIGHQAVESVVSMIHHNDKGIPKQPFSILAEGTWKDGKTTRTLK